MNYTGMLSWYDGAAEAIAAVAGQKPVVKHLVAMALSEEPCWLVLRSHAANVDGQLVVNDLDLFGPVPLKQDQPTLLPLDVRGRPGDSVQIYIGGEGPAAFRLGYDYEGVPE